MLSQLVLNIFVSGGLYALLAFSFSIILNAVKLLPFFLGALALFAAYVVYLFCEVLRVNFFLSVLAGLLITAILTVILNKALFKHFREKQSSEFVLLVAGLAVGIFIENLLLLLFGPDVKTISFPFVNENFEIFGGYVTFIQLVIALISFPFLVASVYFLYRSFFGVVLRALIDQPQMAEILGVNKELAFTLIFALTGFVTGLAGILYGLEYNLEPFVGVTLTVKAFISTIIGGKDVLPGAIIGGFILGLIENLATFYLPSSYKDGVAFVVMFLFLVFMPKGLFGFRLREELGG
ncbi:MAG: branched-chain amino acid ABC transporter permease [Deltaproteobacteria bacterium]|nr:branched-chain amino acid ABC transporter permease [Deltaproteobacteria bacterium]